VGKLVGEPAPTTFNTIALLRSSKYLSVFIPICVYLRTLREGFAYICGFKKKTKNMVVERQANAYPTIIFGDVS
jgi:hypothetical protein